MEWLEIRVKVPVHDGTEGSTLVATIGDAIAACAGDRDRPWLMTSELVGSTPVAALESMLASAHIERRLRRSDAI